ncbi:hypothetical protein L1887_10760 [Cichorium endivia]|nr:hypothetical protein L1887_10760 [Cichorium endivia]
MDSHSKTMAAFFLVLLFLLGSWSTRVQASRLLSRGVDFGTSSSESTLKGFHANRKEPFKKVKSSFRRIPPSRSNPTQNR